MVEVLGNLGRLIMLIACVILLVFISITVVKATRYYVNEYAKPVAKENRKEERDKE